MTEITKKELKKFKLPFQFSVFMAKVLPFNFVRKNIIKSSIKNMGNANDEMIEEIMYTLYSDLSKNTLINMGYLLIDIFNSQICVKDDFKQLESKVLLIFPEKDFFPKVSQESLTELMISPEVIWITYGKHGDPMFNKDYMESISNFLDCIL